MVDMAMFISGLISEKDLVIGGFFEMTLMRCQPSLVVMIFGVFSCAAKHASVKSFEMRPWWIQPSFPELFFVRSSWLCNLASSWKDFSPFARLWLAEVMVLMAYSDFSFGVCPGAGSLAMKMCWTLIRSGVMVLSLNWLYQVVASWSDMVIPGLIFERMYFSCWIFAASLKRSSFSPLKLYALSAWTISCLVLNLAEKRSMAASISSFVTG